MTTRTFLFSSIVQKQENEFHSENIDIVDTTAQFLFLSNLFRLFLFVDMWDQSFLFVPILRTFKSIEATSEVDSVLQSSSTPRINATESETRIKWFLPFSSLGTFDAEINWWQTGKGEPTAATTHSVRWRCDIPSFLPFSIVNYRTLMPGVMGQTYRRKWKKGHTNAAVEWLAM